MAEKYQAFTDASVGVNPFASSPWRPRGLARRAFLVTQLNAEEGLVHRVEVAERGRCFFVAMRVQKELRIDTQGQSRQERTLPCGMVASKVWLTGSSP